MKLRNTKGQYILTRPREGDKICPICKNTFHYIRSSNNPAPKTCSKECRYKSTALNETRKVERICVICNKVFYKAPSLLMNRGNNGDGSYCSKECRYKNKMRWTQKEKIGSKNFIRVMIKKGIIISKPCVMCGRKAQAHHYKGYDRKNWLDIKWLCSKHHSGEHETLRREKLINLS